jgi:hypothetical protein
LSRPLIHNRRHVASATIVGTVALKTRVKTYFSHNVVNGGFRVPLRANVCESVYIDGMNVNSLGVPPQTPLDQTIYSVLADETMGGQQEGREGE